MNAYRNDSTNCYIEKRGVVVKQPFNNIRSADNILRANWSYLSDKGGQKLKKRQKIKQNRNTYLPICRIKTKATKSVEPGINLK
jgi:hypothetical protein